MLIRLITVDLFNPLGQNGWNIWGYDMIWWDLYILRHFRWMIPPFDARLEHLCQRPSLLWWGLPCDTAGLPRRALTAKEGLVHPFSIDINYCMIIIEEPQGIVFYGHSHSILLDTRILSYCGRKQLTLPDVGSMCWTCWGWMKLLAVDGEYTGAQLLLWRGSEVVFFESYFKVILPGLIFKQHMSRYTIFSTRKWHSRVEISGQSSYHL